MLRLDLHVHTSYSRDGRSSPEQMLESAREKGLDGIAITDHNTVEGALEAVDLADDYGLMVVPGIEVSSSKGHIQVLGITEEIEPGLSPNEVIEIAYGLGGVVVVPHPYHWFRHGLGSPWGLGVDAVEVLNSRYMVGVANWWAARGAEEHGMPVTGGSDAHASEFVGQAYTLVDSTPDISSILGAIKAGRTKARGSATSRASYVWQLLTGRL